MPLKQTLLGFKALAVASLSSSSHRKRTQLKRTPSASTQSISSDTIVVAPFLPKAPLPTPDESATDISSQDGQLFSLKEVKQGRGKHVSRAAKARQSQDLLLESTEQHHGPNGRSVSGETLVTSTSQSSLLQSGITALDLPWNMSSVFHEGKGEMITQNAKEMSTESLATMNDEEEQAKIEKSAARKAKMEENAILREARQKAADEKATRRSSRASMLTKASDLVSDVANNVIGKRGRDAYEKGMDKLEGLKNTLRPQSMIEPAIASELAFDRPMSKKRRLSDGSLPTTQSTAARKSFPRRNEKRWLTSGLYAGQSRAFDGRLTESKNKRKQETKSEEPAKENTVLPLPMFAGDRLLKHGRDYKLPFDVFSPLPPGQPKPDEWRKTNKNVFIGEAADDWRNIVLKEHSTCMCRAGTGCDHNCMNRCMYYECDNHNCNLTEEQCGNRNFEGLKQRVKKGGKYNIGVEVIKTADRGYGVRSNRTFEPNQIIVEYTGEIITQDEADSRMRTMYNTNEVSRAILDHIDPADYPQSYYLMLFDQNMIIDATRGSIARFVNHSCDSNCRMEKWTVGGKPRMALFAGDRGIMTGDELTYDYNFDPYSQKNVQECRCGAQKCRGVLGPKPKDTKPKNEESKVRTEGKLAGAKRKIAEAIDEGLEHLSKKAKTTSTTLKPSKVAVVKSKRKVFKVKSPAAVRRKSVSSLGFRTTSSKLEKVVTASKRGSVSRRVVSTSSASEALIRKNGTQSIHRKRSVKKTVENVVNTVRGGKSGRARSIRPITDDVEMEE